MAGSSTLSSSSAIEIPIVIPPMNCERAVLGLMMRPHREHAERRAGRAPRRCRRRRAPRRTARRRRAGRTAPSAPDAPPPCRRAPPLSPPERRLAQASTIADPHDAVPIEPPASIACGSALSPISTRTWSSGTLERVGGDLGQHRPGAGADVGGGDADHVRAVARGRRVRRCEPPAPGGVGRGGDAGPDQPAAVRRAAARVAVGPAEPLGALAQAGDEVAASRTGGRSRGRRRARCGCAARSDRGRTRSRARPSPTRARTCPGTRPARASTTASARRARTSRWVVRRLGAAYIIRVATAVCSANSCTVEVCSTTSWAIAVQPAVGVGAEPDPLDRRRAVAGEREHLLAREGELDRAADLRGAIAARTTCGRGVPFEPKPPPTWGEITRTRRGVETEGLRDRLARRSTRPGSSRTDVRPPPSQTAIVACGSIGLLCSAGVVYVSSTVTAAPRARRRRRPPRCRWGSSG